VFGGVHSKQKNALPIKSCGGKERGKMNERETK
jgi:hypothetical protein